MEAQRKSPQSEADTAGTISFRRGLKGVAGVGSVAGCDFPNSCLVDYETVFLFHLIVDSGAGGNGIFFQTFFSFVVSCVESRIPQI